jgi:glycosyltransferase involved in cell wall biosynthesis
MIAPHFAEYSLRLCEALSRHHDVMLFVNRDNLRAETGDGPSLLPVGLAVRLVRTSSRLRRLWSSLHILLCAALWRPHMVHFQESNNPLTTDVALLLARSFPLALTIHDPIPHQGRDSDVAARRWARRVKVRRAADLVFGHGASCVSELRTPPAGGLARVVETTHGPIMSPTPDQRRESEPGRLLMFGRMEAYKGLRVLVDAIDLLADRGVHPTVVIAGDGPALTELRPRLAGRPNVVVRDGWLSRTQAIEEFQRASAVIAPYLEATQSGVVAAAFANGRPVLASRVGGLPDVVDHGFNGLLSPPGDAPALATAIDQILNDEQLGRHLASGAQSTCEQKLNWLRVAAMLSRDYNLDKIETILS